MSEVFNQTEFVELTWVTDLVRLHALMPCVTEMRISVSQVSIATQEQGSVEPWRLATCNNIEARHEPSCSKCGRVVCTLIPSVTIMALDMRQSERDTKLSFKEKVFAGAR